MKKMLSSQWVIFSAIALFLFPVLLAFGESKPQKIAITGEADFRIGELGGTIEVSDPQSPIYKAGAVFGVGTYRSSKASVKLKSLPSGVDVDENGIITNAPSSIEGRVTYNNDKNLLTLQLRMTEEEKDGLLKLSKNKAWVKAIEKLFTKSENGEVDGNALYNVFTWPEGGTVGADLKTINPTGSPVSSGRAFSSLNDVLTLFIDTDGNGSVDSFPSFLIKDFSNNVITTYADLPTEGTINTVQVLEPPEFTIQIPQNIDILDIKKLLSDKKNIVKGDGVSDEVIPVGAPVSFTITDDVHAGEATVGGIPPSDFAGYATITIPYSKVAVNSLGIDPSDLKLYQLHRLPFPSIKEEVKDVTKGFKVEQDENGAYTGFVTAKVKDFSIFQVVAPSQKSASLPVITDYRTVVKNPAGDRVLTDFSAVLTSGDSGNINIRYFLADLEESASNVNIQYRGMPGNDPAAGWKKIAVQKNVSPTINIKKDLGTYEWNSKSAQKGVGNKSGYFQIRVTPSKKISGKKVKGGAGYSDVFRIDNAKTNLNPPTNLQGTVVEDSEPLELPQLPQVSLNWNASPSGDVSGYNIYRQARFDTGFEKTVRVVGNSSSTSFTDNSLPSAFYEAIYKLTAFDSSGNESTFSEDIKLASIVLGVYYY